MRIASVMLSSTALPPSNRCSASRSGASGGVSVNLPAPRKTAAKKSGLRPFPDGLFVVTVAHDGDDHGMTANWLTQAAFEPPMVVVAIENTSRTIGMVRDSHHFAVNLLLKGQRDLAGKLGRSSDQAPQKLKGIKTKPAPVSGEQVLVDSL